MSWDSYIDNLIGQCTGACDSACIIGQDGSLWTTSANPKNLNLTAGEAATIAKAIKDDNPSTFQTSGIVIGGVKYQYLRNLDNVYLGKKKDLGAITLHKSKTAIVIGHTSEGQQQGNTNKGVGVIAEYLESLGM